MRLALFGLLLTYSCVNNFKIKSRLNKRFSRGISPERLHLYRPARDFICLDKSEFIPFEWVNDDYCDCRDGSDEPGTAACSNSIFYCLNSGFRPHYILSTRVDDGVCDCCDGSDEYSQYVNCLNICRELGDQLKKEENAKKALLAQGHEKYLIYCKLGAQIRTDKEIELTALWSKVEGRESKLTDLQKEKTIKEDLERNLKQLAKSKFDDGSEKSEVEKDRRKALEAFQLVDVNQDERVNGYELKSYFIGPYNEGDNARGRYYLPEPVNFSQFFYSIWKEFRVEFETKEAQRVELGVEYDDMEEITEQEKMESDIYNDEDTKKAIAKAEEVRNDLNQLESELKTLKAKIEETKIFISIDAGTNNEFLPLFTKCFDFIEKEYLYTLCPLWYATQKYKESTESIDLGKWDSWIGDETNRYSVMSYKDGSMCWNGPNRSVEVYLECGSDEELTSVSEPIRCTYIFTFKTSASCPEPPKDPLNQVQIHHDPGDL